MLATFNCVANSAIVRGASPCKTILASLYLFYSVDIFHRSTLHVGLLWFSGGVRRLHELLLWIYIHDENQIDLPGLTSKRPRIFIERIASNGTFEFDFAQFEETRQCDYWRTTLCFFSTCLRMLEFISKRCLNHFSLETNNAFGNEVAPIFLCKMKSIWMRVISHFTRGTLITILGTF